MVQSGLPRPMVGMCDGMFPLLPKRARQDGRWQDSDECSAKPDAMPIFKRSGKPDAMNVSISAGTKEIPQKARRLHLRRKDTCPSRTTVWCKPIAVKGAMKFQDAKAEVDK